MTEHLPGCVARSLAEMYPDEPRPDELSEHAWREVKFEKCVEGCPVLQRSIDRGLELAAEHGW